MATVSRTSSGLWVVTNWKMPWCPRRTGWRARRRSAAAGVGGQVRQVAGQIVGRVLGRQAEQYLGDRPLGVVR